jgi:putative NADH-flavin reductase
MKILLLGASGRLGRHVADGLLGRGHNVRAFIHNQNGFASHRDLTIFQGDVHDANAVGEAIHDVDAVISALGSAAAPVKDVASSGIRNLVSGLLTSAPRRVISVTGSGAQRDRERASPHPHLQVRHEQLMRIIPELVVDGEKHLRLLESSRLDWVVIRAPPMHGEPSPNYVLSSEPPPPETVSSYLAVTTAIMDQLTSDKWCRSAPFVW